MAGSGSVNLGGHHMVRVTLTGRDNATYTGNLILKNLSSFLGYGLSSKPKVANVSSGEPALGSPGYPPDPSGASYYVVAVVLVYGMSIVMLIASHIKRKHAKLVEDKQIHKYLQEFQVVKERSSRDSYKSLKSSIMTKLNMHHRNSTYKTLSHAILPMMAVGLPPHLKEEMTHEIDPGTRHMQRRASFQVNTFRPINPTMNGRRGRRASELDINFRNIRHPSRLSLRRQKDALNLAEQGYLVRSEHVLSSRISEENTPPITKATTDIDILKEGSAARINDPKNNGHYKPLSISKDCRIYEVPSKKPSNNFLKPWDNIPIIMTPDSDFRGRRLSDSRLQVPINVFDNSETTSLKTDRLEVRNPALYMGSRKSSIISDICPLETIADDATTYENTETLDVQRGQNTTSEQTLQIHNLQSNTPTQRQQKSPSPVSESGSELSANNPFHRSANNVQPANPGDPCNDQRTANRIDSKDVNSPFSIVPRNEQLNSLSTTPAEVPPQSQVQNKTHTSSSVVNSCAFKKPFRLDVVVNIHHRPGRSQASKSSKPSPPHQYATYKHSNEVEPVWNSATSANKSPPHHQEASDLIIKKKLVRSSFVETPSKTESLDTPDSKRCSDSYDSMSFPSENSSDSDDVWLVMTQKRMSEQETMADSEDEHLSSPELAIHGAGTTPLLKPGGDGPPRFDAAVKRNQADGGASSKARSPSCKSYSSLSVSPDHSKTGDDGDNLAHRMHQITSV